MIDFERRVGIKGQIVIPKEIRRITGIDIDSDVLVTIQEDMVLIKKPENYLAEKLRKLVEKDGKFLKRIDSDKDYDEQLADRTL